MEKIEDAVRFKKLDKEAKDYDKKYKDQWAFAKIASENGNIICLSDLMINSKKC